MEKYFQITFQKLIGVGLSSSILLLIVVHNTILDFFGDLKNIDIVQSV